MNNDATLKTIYSPSPSGFVEPKTAAFTGFTSTGGKATSLSQFNISGSSNKGYNFYTNGWKNGALIFIPALGGIDVWVGRASTTGKGFIAWVDSGFDFWTNGANSITDALCFAGELGAYVDPTEDDARSYGDNILSVKE